jgi:two-component system, chemotaxis family, protein-glutamate methylesterase/glutaminase
MSHKYSGMVAKRDIITIGGSAGGLEALIHVVASLPPDLPAAVFVVLHLSSRSPNYIPEILRKRTAMQVLQASDGERIQTGTIYVAPPDRHLLIGDNHIHLSRGPKEGLQRPSINATFRSAAEACGERVIGVLLSGMLDDGAAGIWEIAKCKGVTVVQDPAEAPFPSMPLSALTDAIVHHTLTVSEIGRLLTRLVDQEITPALRKEEVLNRSMARFSGFTCPECRGPLYENGQKPVEFRCRVGHVMSLGTLLEEHTSTQERKLYEAMVALEEGADLADRVASSDGAAKEAELRKEADQLRRNADVIRKLLEERT